jgi:hypothetical protein
MSDDWHLTIAAADDSIPEEEEPVSYQIGHRRLDLNPAAAAMAPVPGASIRAVYLAYRGSPIFIPASIARLPPP